VKNYQGKLQFEGYRIEKIVVERLEDSKEAEATIGFMFKIAPDNKKKIERANVLQGVQIESNGSCKYRIEIIIKGNFRIEDTLEEEKEMFLKANASAILFPYLRSLLSLITSQLECETIILPTMNFQLFFEDADNEEIFISEENFEEF